MRDPLSIRAAYRQLVQKRPGLLHRCIGVVSREHNSLDADLEQQIEECRREVESAERIVNILAEVTADRTIQFGHSHRHHIKSLQHEGQSFSHVADHDLELRVLVKNSAEDETKDMNRGL